MTEAAPLDLRFRTALRRMIAAGRVARVDRAVDTHLELAGLMKRHDGERALLFDRVKGSTVPVIGNLLASTTNVEAAFGTDRHGVRDAMQRAIAVKNDPLARQLRTMLQDLEQQEQASGKTGSLP